MGVILHWLNVELWSPMWPNIFSPNVWSLVAIAIHLIVTMVHRERLHRDMKQHVTAATGGGDEGPRLRA